MNPNMLVNVVVFVVRFSFAVFLFGNLQFRDNLSWVSWVILTFSSWVSLDY